MRMKIKNRVERSAKLLDRLYPTWFRRVDLAKLDMSDGHSCVAGQLAHSYRVGTSDDRGYDVFVDRLVSRVSRDEQAELDILQRGYPASELAFGSKGLNDWKREIRNRQQLDRAQSAA